MRNDQSIERIAGPGLRERGDYNALEAVGGHPDRKQSLKRPQGISRRRRYASEFVEILHLQHHRRREDEIRGVDQRPRAFAELFRLPVEDPRDDVGIEAGDWSSDHS